MRSITRRGLIQGAAFLSAGLIARKQAFPALQTSAPLTLDPNTLARYVDPLPIPEIARPLGFRAHPEDAAGKLPYYRIAMRELESKLHRDLPATRVWSFGASAPGPTFDTRSGEGLLVEWANELPSGKHFLPVDHTLHGAEPGLPEVRSVIHLHGGKTPASSDGYPEDWRVPGRSLTCHYPNRQAACMLFYHDHTMGINRLNIYAGMMGLFFVRDDYEESLDLPRGQYEVPLLVYDRLLRPDGQLYYPVSGKPDAPWVPEVFGDAMLVNGKLFPYLDVEPRRYRFRLMNGSNGRFFRFSFSREGTRNPGPGLGFLEIGTEQGFLPSPAAARRLTMAPAERADLIFDFSGYAGEKLLLRSDSFEIMEFRVSFQAAGRNGAPQAAPLPGKDFPTAAPFVKLSDGAPLFAALYPLPKTKSQLSSQLW